LDGEGEVDADFDQRVQGAAVKLQVLGPLGDEGLAGGVILEGPELGAEGGGHVHEQK